MFHKEKNAQKEALSDNILPNNWNNLNPWNLLNAPEEEVPEPDHVRVVQPFEERQLSAFPPLYLQQKMLGIELKFKIFGGYPSLSVTCQNDFESEVFAVPLLPRRRLPRSRIRPVDFSDTGAEDDAEASHAKNAEFLRTKKKLIRFSKRAFLPRIRGGRGKALPLKV